jgi:hypothetical protein
LLVVGTAADVENVEDAVEATHPDFVVVGIAERGIPRTFRTFLLRRALPPILGIEATAGNGFRFELRPVSVPLGPLAPDGVVEAMRVAAPSAIEAQPMATESVTTVRKAHPNTRAGRKGHHE